MDATPVEDVEAAYNWRKPVIVTKVPDRNKSVTGKSCLLLCHDMKNGYHEHEKLDGGSTDPSVPGNPPFIFLHWRFIDTFVYFSHHFITIPPPAYTVQGHKHGVRVLGTILTEGDRGAELCEQFLADEVRTGQMIKKLREIMITWQFDGYLVNIENDLSQRLTDRLYVFLKQLKVVCTAAHEDCLIVWYDAVTKTGKLDWQNSLNAENRCFYDVCDGIFLNYGWTIRDLEYIHASHLPRGKDTVHVGIDVFGRQNKGGWETSETLRKVHSRMFSAAIFAPGWIVENFPDEDPILQQLKFWKSMADVVVPRPIAALPIKTNFRNGLTEDGKFYCMMEQGLQPHLALNAELFPAWNGLRIERNGDHLLFVVFLHATPRTRVLVECNKPITVLFNGRPLREVNRGEFRTAEPSRSIVRTVKVRVTQAPILITSFDLDEDPIDYGRRKVKEESKKDQ